MKNFFTACVAILLVGCAGRHRGGMQEQTGAQTGGAVSAAPTVTERGRDFRVWQTVRAERLPDGGTIQRTNGYTELTTGMHYFQDGQWQESQALIEPLQDGAIAQRGPTKVTFSANLHTSGALTIFTPDGTTLRSHVVGLAYFDAQTGNSVWIAQTRDSIGTIIGGNQVLYEDAFTEIRADVRYTYKRSGIEQDVILRRNDLPDAAALGLGPNLENIRLQVVTEFLQPPVPVVTQTTIEREADPVRRAAMQSPDFNDQTIALGDFHFIRGKAFSLGAEPAKVPVGKSWETINERKFLVEAVKLNAIRPQLDLLPVAAALQKKNEKVVAAKPLPRAVVLAQVQSPPSGKKGRPMEIAALPNIQPGFVIDFQAVSSAANFTFQADTTYYVSGEVYFSGDTTLEGGTVIKCGADYFGVYCEGPVICKTDRYRPAIFTAKSDNSVGDIITGSTGIPTVFTESFGLACTSGSSALRHLRVSYMDYGVAFMNASEHTLTDSQFTHCHRPILGDGGPIKLQNILFDQISTAMTAWSPTAMAGEHLTVHRAATLISSVTLSLTNSILSLVTNLGTFTGSSNATNDNDSTLFQTVGAGAHYLADPSPYRDAGTTNIAPALALSLKKTTTYPPLIIAPGGYYGVSQTLFPRAGRDTDLPDLGYHFDPLDYAITFVHLTNATIQIDPGTAIAVYNPSNTTIWGLGLAEGAQFISNGRADSKVTITHYATVQEMANTNWNGPITGLVYPALGAGTPAFRCRFTDFTTLAGNIPLIYGGAVPWQMTDCQFHGGNLYNSGGSMFITNCLFNRNVSDCYLSGSISNQFRNCTFHGGKLLLGSEVGLMTDSLFAGTTDLGDVGILSDIINSNIAYTTNSPYRIQTTNLNDVILTSLTFQTGPLGYFYIPSNALVNAGSRNATNAGLFHYTMLTNQVKETNSQVDIGFHVPATDANGTPLDYDGDGVPDYWEDQNGDGSVNSGETDWKDANDQGLRVYITKPKEGLNIP